MLTGIKNVMGIIETVKMITFEEGIEQGIQKGIEQGIEKGIEQGIEKGREEEKALFVENLLLNTDFDLAKIAALAGVTEGFVQTLKSKKRQ